MVVAIAVAVAVLVAVGAVLLLRGGGGDDRAGAARDETEQFLDAWATGKLADAADRTDDAEAALSLLESVDQNMHPEELSFEVADDAGEEHGEDGAMAVPFTATFTLEGLGPWSYESTAVLLPGAGGDEGGESWTVRWESALVHPRLEEGQTLVLTTQEAERAPILAADGSELAGPTDIWHLSIWPAMLTDPDEAYRVLDGLDVGIDTEALADEVEAADPDQAVPVVSLRDSVYDEHAADLRAVDGLQFEEDSQSLPHAAEALVGGTDPETGAGASGLQSRYDEQLAGTSSGAVVIADRESGDAVSTLHEQKDGEPGTPVQTTIDPEVQQAAEDALRDLDQDAAIVALQPSTGHVLAAADRPSDGFNLSLQGQLAPGSTFKIVSTAALLEGGTLPADQVGCPQYVDVNGQTFENQGEFELGPDTTLQEAFTESCNTAFIDNLDRFEEDTLHETAQAFGIGGEWSVGAATFDGLVPPADGENELAASLIGQGRVQASPLVMASVAATVEAGAFHQPVLVPDAVSDPYQAPAELSAGTLDALRAMMRDTVTVGSASALDGIPGSPHAKTGTAEFTDEDGELSTNAWMVGYLADADLAFAVVLTDGGSGGADAGPVAADFLGALG